MPAIPVDIITDVGRDCIAATTKVGNLALSHLGISFSLTSLATDDSKETDRIRLHYPEAVGQILRAFDWPAFTAYADLTLAANGGTALVRVNQDWQYAYSLPSDCVKVRRICSRAGMQREYEETPATFRIGQMAGVPVLYTNEESTDLAVQIEYTARLACPASAGDYLFISALSWKLAALIAPDLSRSEKVVLYCEQKAQIEVETAKATSVNEQQMSKDGEASWISGR